MSLPTNAGLNLVVFGEEIGTTNKAINMFVGSGNNIGFLGFTDGTGLNAANNVAVTMSGVYQSP